MAQKVLIGAAVLAGGAYLYDQNVSPIFSQEKVQAKYDLQKLEHQTKDFGHKLTDKLEDTKKDLSKKTTEYKKKVEQSDLYNTLKDKTENFKDQAKQYKYDVKDAATPESEKNAFVRGVHSYIDKVNELGGSVEERTPYSTVSGREEIRQQKSWWESWFGAKETEAEKYARQAKNDAERYGQKVKNDAEQTKNSWLNWGSKKADEAERTLNKEADVARSDYYKTKSSAEGAFNDAKKAAEGTYNDVKQSAEKYGTTAYNEGRDIAIRAYQAAREEYDDLASSLNSADKQHNLEKAKQNINAALGNLQAYGQDVVNDVNRKFK